MTDKRQASTLSHMEWFLVIRKQAEGQPVQEVFRDHIPALSKVSVSDEDNETVVLVETSLTKDEEQEIAQVVEKTGTQLAAGAAEPEASSTE